MDTKKIISSIIDLDNELKALKNMLKPTDDKVVQELTIKEQINQEIFLLGLKHTVTNYFNPFEYSKDLYNKDTNEYMTFDAWVQTVRIDSYNRKYFPEIVQDNLSNKQIIELYKPYLKYEYDLLIEKNENALKTNESCEC